MESAVPSTAPSVASSSAEAPESEFTFRGFLEIVILFLIIILLVWSLALEPFGVPTGSMAMTMVGNHKACDCPRCGFRIIVGHGGAHNDPTAAERAYASAWCPNCGQGDLHLERVPESFGDRLLVDKNLFELRGPRRWEVAVFRNPSDMRKPYVKRVVGMPGERVQIRGGDVYINEHLARKTLAESRATRVLVFDQSFHPPGGWGPRWRRCSGDESASEWQREQSNEPANEFLDGAELKWSAAEQFRWLTYRHWLLDECREQSVRDWFAYNGAALQQELCEVHDFSVEFDIEATGTGVLGLKLTDGHSPVVVQIPILDGSTPAVGATLSGVELPPPSSPSAHLRSGRKQRVEFALVDRRVSLAIDGKEAFPAVDLPEVQTRPGVSRPLAIGVRGAAVTIQNLRLFRDVHYSASGRNGIAEAWPLGPDEYFLLGDNSPNSEDSRFWSRPGVPRENFLGRPLLLHQPSRWSTVQGYSIQSLDWGRVRWIR